jgi:hypothetical protein
MPERGSFQRLIIVGLPRSGTTLLAALLGAQTGVHFLTEYFPAFSEALHRIGKSWNGELSASERRIALALVRDQFVRDRHPVLVQPESFVTLNQLHRSVLEELAGAQDAWIGHKLLLGPELLRSTLAETNIHCLVLFRDPRDAALSYFHRTGGGVERYVRNWSATLRLWQELRSHPRLLGLRFEDLVSEPARTLTRLGDWLGQPLDPRVAELRFRRSRAHGETAWADNSAFRDVKTRFDRAPLGRWRRQLSSPIVRYADWATRDALPLLAYEPIAEPASSRERLRFGCLDALEVGEQRAVAALGTAVRRIRKRLLAE